MKRSTSLLRFVIAISVLMLMPVLLTSKNVLAKPVTFTQNLSNITETVAVTNPCLGPMTATLNYDGVFHVTADGNTYHVVSAIHGTATVVPADPSQESFSGSFSEVFSDQLNRSNAVTTFTVTQVGPNMKFHITFHLAVDEEGVKVFVLNVACEP